MTRAWRKTVFPAGFMAVLGIATLVPAGTTDEEQQVAHPQAQDRDTPGPGVIPATVPSDAEHLRLGHPDDQILSWFGLRPMLAEKGLDFDASITADFSKNLHGGADTENDVSRHLFDFRATLDAYEAFGWAGATFSVDFQNQAGRNGSDLYGDAQGFDNIDADGRTQVSELWFEQTLGENDAFRIKVGKVDANTEFAVAEYAGEFINSSFAYSPTLTAFPTYPDPAVSMNLFLQPAEWLYVGYGLYDGDGVGDHSPRTLWRGPADFFHVAEAGLKWKLDGEKMPGRVAVGVTYANGKFDRFRGGQQHGTASAYAIAEQQILDLSDGSKTGRGVFAFVQLGTGDEEVNAIRHHVGCGLFCVGPYQAELPDTCGIGVTTAFFSDAAGAGFTEDSETAVEAFYNFQATPYLSIKPDLQYIVHPGGDAALDDALVATLRVTLAL